MQEHAVEAVVSNGHTSILSAYSIKIFRFIARNLITWYVIRLNNAAGTIEAEMCGGVIRPNIN
jgi:alcohol dehydrogenase class IV